MLYTEPKFLKPTIRFIAVFTIVVALVAIVGWVFNVPFLHNMLPRYESMKLNTALCFLLSGIFLALSPYRLHNTTYRNLSLFINVTVVVIAALSLMQYLLDVDFGIDELLINDEQSRQKGLPHPGRMAHPQAFCFLLLHTGALLFFSVNKIIHTAGEILLHLCSLSGLLIVLGYVYGVRYLQNLEFISDMSTPTALLFMALSLAVVFLIPEKGIAGVLTGNYIGSVIARKLVPQFTAIAMLMGLARTYTFRNSNVDEELSIVLSLLIYIVMGTVLVWIAANTLNALDEKRTEAEKQLEASNRSLEERNIELTQFSYAVAHDLKTPLRAVSGYANLLLNEHGKSLDADARRYVDAIDKSSERMGKLINDLLRFSGLGKVSFTKKPTDMNIVVKEALEDFRLVLETKKVELILHPLERALCDASLIRNVWDNLISNAVKFSQGKEHPVIEIGMKQTADGMAYYIKDNGVGLDMKYADKLFNVFERLHEDEEYEGTGVGLAIAERIIERHGGEIWVESEEHKGAMFYFLLPSV